MKGRIQIETISSLVLKDNPLGDPRRREIPVYLPPSHGEKPVRRFPVIYYLPGFPGGGRSALNYKLWTENIVERFDRLIAEKKAQEAVLVIPDCATAYGGSQYLNSSATGRYEDHLVDEMVPYIEDKFAVCRSAEGRGVMGKSSGGFGALTLGMRHPDVFGHVASHSGDMLFERAYGLDFAKFVGALHAYGGSAEAFVKAFRASRDKEGFDHASINTIAMAACYSPNPKNRLGFDLPCGARTAELLPKVWARWKALDPVQAVSSYRGNLRRLRTLFFDAGRSDEFFLHLGARALSDRLKTLGVRHIHEEHDRGHFDMAARYDRSLALLSSRLSRGLGA